MIGFRLTEQQKALIESGYFRVDRDHWNAEARRWYESANYRLLTPRWKFLTPHPIQTQMVPRRFRFNLVPKGRRSGGSERWKRELVRDAITPRNYPGRFMFSAPTRTQAKALGWDDLKELVPRRELDPTKGRLGISESELTIFLRSGNRIMVVGLDEPRRVEGQALDGAVIDEIQQIKPKAWTSSIRPALSTAGRQGWAALVGRPEGKNHFYEWVRKFGIPDEETEWGLFAWPSWDILPDAEIKSARATIDDVSFAQEYGAEFVTFDGRAYHSFVRQVHAAERLSYDPTLPLIFCFDFNREPGVACVVQDQPYRGKNPSMAPEFTAVIGEVWIEKNSNTQRVADRLIQDWSHHRGLVALEGDATGGAQGSAKVAGSDWDIIKNAMRPVPGWEVRDRVPRANPLERTRVNAMNARLMAADGTIRMLIDPVAAPHVANDLDDTALLAGGSGEIDKPSKGERSIQTHMCFAAGTMVAHKDGDMPIEKIPERGIIVGPRLNDDGRFVEFIEGHEYHGGGVARGYGDVVDVLSKEWHSVRCTPNHRFLTTDQEWVEARDLTGKYVWGLTRPILVTAVVPAGKATLYCPTVPSVGCFALWNGMIVSNSDALGYYVVRKYPIVASSPHLSISLG